MKGWIDISSGAVFMSKSWKKGFSLGVKKALIWWLILLW